MWIYVVCCRPQTTSSSCVSADEHQHQAKASCMSCKTHCFSNILTGTARSCRLVPRTCRKLHSVLRCSSASVLEGALTHSAPFILPGLAMHGLNQFGEVLLQKGSELRKIKIICDKDLKETSEATAANLSGTRSNAYVPGSRMTPRRASFARDISTDIAPTMC